MSTDSRIQVLVIRAGAVAPTYPSSIEPDVALYQRIVGGYIEAAYGETHTGERVVFYINEDGVALGLPLNEVATRMWHRLNPAMTHQVLRGDVIVLGADGPEDADVPPLAADLARVIHHDIEVEHWSESIRRGLEDDQ
ncbi:DUF3846 domain-containing protein [Mycolicibacterium fallax]|uniref:DUF3846 domain-containing protein n=1 Tax=Mycolicibacterium fallax TaxID=1793 RepID=A0A1X1R7U7_MYCFA|nr:DUF3846 domain-containing protein [Mycolicibacterium fallax]ORV00982.1 hypothetical protein AWC04_15025 [Mycolicibacterium fallax]BBZ00542.1 hypothetical protein MFAL_40080 [Mycolicibacterium fallax]